MFQGKFNFPRKRPDNADLSLSKAPVAASLPSALATARNIDDLGHVPYPEGIKGPNDIPYRCYSRRHLSHRFVIVSCRSRRIVSFSLPFAGEAGEVECT